MAFHSKPRIFNSLVKYSKIQRKWNFITTKSLLYASQYSGFMTNWIKVVWKFKLIYNLFTRFLAHFLNRELVWILMIPVALKKTKIFDSPSGIEPRTLQISSLDKFKHALQRVTTSNFSNESTSDIWTVQSSNIDFLNHMISHIFYICFVQKCRGLTGCNIKTCECVFALGWHCFTKSQKSKRAMWFSHSLEPKDSKKPTFDHLEGHLVVLAWAWSLWSGPQ